MRRLYSALGWLPLLIILCALNAPRAWGQAQITNPEVLANNVGGLETGTENTQFIFRATVVPSDPAQFMILWARVYIDPVDPGNPEFGAGTASINMVSLGGGSYVAYIPGYLMGLGGHTWSVVAQEGPGATGGVLMNGTGAGPKPAGNLSVVASASPMSVQFMPMTSNYLPDKRANRGQLGGGLQVLPFDSTSPQDGGSSHIFTWRVRVNTPGGIPLQLPIRRTNYEWRDVRFDPPGVPLLSQYNAPLILVLIDPSGQRHLCPMEFDLDAPGGSAGLTFANVYTHDALNPGSVWHPTGNAMWTDPGVYFRYRLLPVQYQFNWGPLQGEGPYTAFGGPTQPDLLPAIPLGMQISGEVIGRPFTNQYVGFAGPDRATPIANFSPPFPYYTNTAGRAGQWRYYYMATTDLRPPRRPGFPSNGDVSRYPGSSGAPADNYGADPDGYNYAYESDNGMGVSSPATPYLHPMVTPILSDGGWTDDLPENGYAAGVGGMTHRSRPTTKTRVRFQVRVTKADNSPLPASAVRVFVDGVGYQMQKLQRAGNDDFLQGIVYYYDTQFSQGKEGQHFIYFLVDDGIHKAIWPRRDTSNNGTGDTRFTDNQAALPSYSATFNNQVEFGTNTVGKNYLNEPLVNHRPLLSNPSINPASGSYGTKFTYEVLYTDVDNDAPLDGDVVIDGKPHRMTRAPEDINKSYVQGVRYRFEMTLNRTPDDKHTYYFRFRDNWNRLAEYMVSQLRREYGEWQTLPAGDDNGNPAFEIVGPTIIGNRSPELTEASFFASDQAHTPATLYDFIVKYKDEDNNQPTTLKLFMSSDNGLTWNSGIDMVPAESSTNYVAGVLFHLTQRIKLPVGGPYWFRFRASDGVQSTDTSLVHVGTRGNAILDGTARELKLLNGSTTVYSDPNNTATLNSTKVWYNDPSTLYIWKYNGSTYTRLNYGTDFVVDFPNGQLTLAQPTNDKILASYFYEITVGPMVVANAAPLLVVPDPGNNTTNEGTLSPLLGSPSTTFRYSIIYKDQDNQPPTYVNLIIDSNTTIAMTMDAATPNPPNFANGVKYNASTTLQVGPHIYHFETSDGVDVGRYPAAGATPPDLSGPTVTDPTNLINPLIQHSRGQIDTTNGPQTRKGTSADLYTFTVTFRNPAGNGPPPGGIEVRLRNQLNGNEIKAGLNPIDPIGIPEFQAGVRYQVQLSRTSSPPILPGTYDVTFGFASNAQSGTAPLVLIINGRPVLTGPTANPDPASQAGDITLAITYSDVNSDPPSEISLYIDGAKYTAVNPITVPANPTPAEYRAGVLHQWTLQAKNLGVGAHNYYFMAKDDLEDSNPPAVPAPPGNTFNIGAAKSPLLQVPGGDATNNNGTLTPIKGSTTQTYTYAVKYKHGDGVLPSTIDVTLDEGTAQERVIPLAPLNGTPTDADIKLGVIYQVALNDLASGRHTYRFKATDRLAPAAGHSVTLPTPTANPYQGPTVNFPPSLSGGTAYVFGSASMPNVSAQNQLTPVQNGNVLTKWVFEVTFTDADGAPPAGGYVRVTINNSQVFTLAPKAGQTLNYRNGVVFTTIGGTDSVGNPLSDTGVQLSAGQKVFHFDAYDTLDSARFPVAPGSEIGGLTVANIPVLEKINLSGGDDGTLAPLVGPLSTVFTYKVRYKNADNTAPVYVRVNIDGAPYDMAKTVPTASNFAAGVEYQYQHRFPSGSNHSYYFEAGDSVSLGYVARYPGSGELTGPSVNVPVFDPATLNPQSPRLGQSVTITSRLIVGQGTFIGDFIAIKLVRPDGTGLNDRAATDPATGVFNYTFVPSQTGDWKVQFSWGGSAGTYDPLTTEHAFKVTTEPLYVGPNLDMIAIPLVPVTPSPELTFAPTTPTGTPVPITELNLIKWVLSGLGGGQYSALNIDGSFPGMTGGQGYWMRPTTGLNINPKGRLWDQTQVYEIPLQTGWNMVGSVYLQDINWSAVKARVNGTLVALTDPTSPVRPVAWTYNPGTGAYQAVSAPTGVMKAYRGYWVRATTPTSLVLNIPGARSASISRDVLDRSTAIQVGVRSGDRVETDNFAPVTGLDKSRLALNEKPPYMENYVSVRFIPADSSQLPANTRATAANQTMVTFDVETDRKNSDVTVFFPNASQIGRKTEGTLIDLSSGTSRAISTSSGVTYNTGENSKPRRFALLIESVRGAERLVISSLRAQTRGQGTFAVNYSVSVSATMRATIVGAAGSAVRDLDKSRAVTRGVNSLVWDGKDNRGVSVPSGTYTLKLTGTDERGNVANAIVPIVVSR